VRFEVFTAVMMMILVLAPCSLHGTKTQKKTIILSAVKTSNLTWYHLVCFKNAKYQYVYTVKPLFNESLGDWFFIH
jgi:hypothetical protein